MTTTNATYDGGGLSSGRGLWGRRRGLDSLYFLSGDSSSGLSGRHYCRYARYVLEKGRENESDMEPTSLRTGKRIAMDRECVDEGNIH